MAEFKSGGARSWKRFQVILTFSVVPKPLALEAIEVEVERRSLPLAEQGFYDRERIGLGHFIGPERLERRAAFRTSDLLRAVPGVRILQSSGIAGLGSYPVTRAGVRSGLRVDGPPCFPRIYLDGVVVEQGGRQWPFSDFDALVAPSDLEGMEVYRSQVEMPAQYSGLSACGAILLWTKRGR